MFWKMLQKKWNSSIAFVDKGLLERLNNIVNSDLVRVTYTEAVEFLQESGEKFEYPVEWGM